MSGRRRDGRWESGSASERDKENDVRSLLRFLLMVFLSMGVWMAIGLGVGVLLHRLVPAINLGVVFQKWRWTAIAVTLGLIS